MNLFLDDRKTVVELFYALKLREDKLGNLIKQEKDPVMQDYFEANLRTLLSLRNRVSNISNAMGPTEYKRVCLCGSTRFKDEMLQAAHKLTLAGYIVLMPNVFGHCLADDEQITDEQKLDLDEMHLRKIDMANFVFVVDVGGYVGESTTREIAYARKQGKGVIMMSDKYP